MEHSSSGCTLYRTLLGSKQWENQRIIFIFSVSHCLLCTMGKLLLVRRKTPEVCPPPCIWHGLPCAAGMSYPRCKQWFAGMAGAAASSNGDGCPRGCTAWRGKTNPSQWEPGSRDIPIPAPCPARLSYSKTLGSTRRVRRWLYSPYLLIPQPSSVKSSLPHPGTLSYAPNHCPL